MNKTLQLNQTVVFTIATSGVGYELPFKNPKDYVEKDFIDQPDIQHRRAMFLMHTVCFYNNSNRAVTSKMACVYEPTACSPGCAIGKWATSMHYKTTFLNRGDRLPDWMAQMGYDFLRSVQILHDGPTNWTDDGISRSGKIYVNTIIKHNDLPCTSYPSQ